MHERAVAVREPRSGMVAVIGRVSTVIVTTLIAGILMEILARLVGKKPEMVAETAALAGRATAMKVPETHYVLGTPLRGDFPGMEQIQVGMGCFWGAEKKFWKLPGVVSTAAGYAGGYTENPTYNEVCSGRTGHTEAVNIVYDPKKTSVEAILSTVSMARLREKEKKLGCEEPEGMYLFPACFISFVESSSGRITILRKGTDKETMLVLSTGPPFTTIQRPNRRLQRCLAISSRRS